MNTTIANLYGQITGNTRLVLGAKNFMYDNDKNSLTFNVTCATARGTHKFVVTYDSRQDAYTVELWKIQTGNARNGYTTKCDVVKRGDNIQASGLNETLMLWAGW